MVSRAAPEIERKWFTIRILISLTSVVLCLVVPGILMYECPNVWAHVAWGSLFLAVFAFMVNIGIGEVINRRVKTLVMREYKARYATSAAALLDDSDDDYEIPQASQSDTGLTDSRSDVGPSDLTSLVREMQIALGLSGPTSIRVIDEKPASDDGRIEDQANSYDPKSRLANRQII